jgi:hypothetical protein
VPGWEGGEGGLSWQQATHATDGVLDAAFLPRGMWVTEVGLNGQPVQPLMARELSSIVEGDGLSQATGHGLEQADEPLSDGACGFGSEPPGEDEA